MASVFKRIGIDLGTQNLRVVTGDQGIIWSGPCCLAVQKQSGKVLAVGHEAVDWQGRMISDSRVIWPVEQGVVAYPDELIALLKVVLKPLWKPALLIQPTLVVTVPVGSTVTQRQVLTDLLLKLGAREVVLVAQPLGAMIGAGVPVADPTGSCFLHLGQGVVEAGVIALGRVGIFNSSTEAGNYLDWRLRLRLQFEHRSLVSYVELEQIKRQVVTFNQESKQADFTVKDTGTGEPARLALASDMFRYDLAKFVDKSISVIRKVLQNAPAELVADSVEKGVLLSGGLSLLEGLDGVLAERLQTPVVRVDQPVDSVALGLATIMVHLDEYRQSQRSYQS